MRKAAERESRSGWSTLTPGQYAQLVKDLHAATRAFALLAEIDPAALHRLRGSHAKQSGMDVLADAHEALDRLVREVRRWRHDTPAPPSRQRLALVRRKR